MAGKRRGGLKEGAVMQAAGDGGISAGERQDSAIVPWPNRRTASNPADPVNPAGAVQPR
ncbi:MAG: hypothetical protein IIC13_10355 [SAR324 cluster bacterium]|nr:hypothetical protein [SAR324 cluster bacterium]